MTIIDLDIDVTEAAGLGEPAHVSLTVHLPDPGQLPETPIVCFAKPGGGYSKGYYTVDLPGPASGSQAGWHAARGWIFVSVDHLGVGASSIHEDSNALTFGVVAAANEAAEREVLRRLRDGDFDFPPITEPLTLGIGQSMGGCMTIIQQGRHRSYDGIAVLGYSAVYTHPPTPPGTAPIVAPWVPRDALPTDGVFLNEPALTAFLTEITANPPAPGAPPPMGWGFHYDDVDASIVLADLTDFPTRGGDVPAWASATLPTVVATWCIVPGAVAPEAAAIDVPVLVAAGERDVMVDPRGELRAYRTATSVDWFECPRMGHMHNFAGTRELFWRRIEAWGDWVVAQAQASRS